MTVKDMPYLTWFKVQGREGTFRVADFHLQHVTDEGRPCPDKTALCEDAQGNKVRLDRETPAKEVSDETPRKKRPRRPRPEDDQADAET